MQPMLLRSPLPCAPRIGAPWPHTLDPVAAAKNAYKLLKPAGVAFIETPNNAAFGLKVAGTAWPWLDVPRHLNFFTQKSLDAVVRMVGLEPEGVEYLGYCRQFGAHWRRDTQEIFSFLRRHRDPRTSRWRKYDEVWSWGLLAITLLAPPERKYDSIRIVARRP